MCRRRHGGREILKGIDLTVNAGEVVVIMGPSGSGKSTLLRMINHLEPMDWGEITVNGTLVGYDRLPGGGVRQVRKRLAQSRAAARIGMVFQHFNLFEHLTALENISEAPVTVYRQKPEEARAIATRPAQRGRSGATSPTTCRTVCPAGSSSEWRSRAPWRCNPE